MVQTKHLIFLVFVAFVFGGYSFYNIGFLDSVPPTVERSISSESDPQVVDVAAAAAAVAEGVAESTGQVVVNENDTAQIIEHVETVARTVVQTQVDDLSKAYTKLCNMPREFVNPQIFDQYCRNRSCLRAGESCGDASSCCSKMCIKNRCASDNTHKLLPGETCRIDNDCYTNNCSAAPGGSYKICYGDNTTPYCSRVGQTCRDNRHCCSASCNDNKCWGSRKEPAPIGYPCRGDNAECESRFCNLERRRCE